MNDVLRLEPTRQEDRVDRSAVIDGEYRYELRRVWDAFKPLVAFVALNPSTADAMQDDPTVRRMMAFARGWGHGGLVLVNMYGLRATDPRALRGHPDPIGPENDRYVRDAAREAALVVACWGALGGSTGLRRWVGGAVAPTFLAVLGQLESVRGAVHCLGCTQDGAPRHPLYLRRDVRPVLMSGKED